MSDQPESNDPQASGPLEPAAGDGVGDQLRAAVERTLAATADSATGTRQRAQDLLDDVVRRGQVARDEVARRGEGATTRLAEAVSELRRADAEGVEELAGRLDGIEARLALLETASNNKSNPEVKPELTSSEPHQQAETGE